MKSAASSSVKPEGIFRLVSAEPSSAGSAPVRLLEFKVPSKLVDVVTPVTTAPSGSFGALPEVLPLRLVTLKSDIRDLRFEVRQ